MPGDLVVFSHPNHELAVFGLLQRRRPALVYLTDGGGADRVAQTREGLRSIGLLEQATFLDHAEGAFYAALLARDVRFLLTVAQEVAAAIAVWRPQRVLCDAVEYYNPVHDLSLPLVCRAMMTPEIVAATPVRVFEIPLIHQTATATGEQYVVQRPAGARHASPQTITLTRQELAAKLDARDRIYTLLSAQLGPVITALTEDHLSIETLVPAESPTRPIGDAVLRYEWRAERLCRSGAIAEAITYRDHFLPIAAALSEAAPEHPVAAARGV